MEPNHELTAKIIMKSLTDPNFKPLSQIVVSYLDNDDLELLNGVFDQSKQQNTFGQLIRTSYFINKYLNQVDRSFYYNFYQEKQYIDLQRLHLSVLANNYSNCFLSFPKQFTQIINFMKKLLPALSCAEELGQEIERMVTDTDIPLPKLKRQNQGMFCKTSFQNFLIALKYRQCAYEEGIPCFDELKQLFESRDQKYLTDIFLKFKKQEITNKNNQNSDHIKILTLRFAPYKIVYDNYEQFLIEKFSLHNFLVSVFVLTDIWLTSLQTYLSSLQDPFQQYVQLITRYSIYRNFVIQVEQTLSFTFQQYNQLYSEVFDSQKPQYRFWRAAMTKWLLKFQKFHEDSQKIYYYCFNKLRTNNLINFLSQKQTEEPNIYMQIKNKMQLREYELQINQQVFPFQTSNGVEDFFKNNQEQYQVITIQFMEYMIDLSINQETVHWCGHSEQQLSQPFMIFEKNILERNKDFLAYLRKSCKNEKNKNIFFKEYFKNEIDFLSSLQVKPMTIRKIVQYFNLEIADNPLLKQPAQLINFDYQSNDELLKYFNAKAKIKFSLNAEQLLFYSINPLVSAQELLTKSTNSTNYTVNEHNDGEEDDQGDSQCYFEYCSESSSVGSYQQEDTSKSLDVHIEIPTKFLNNSGKKLKGLGGLTKKISMKYPQQQQKKQKVKNQKKQMKINNPYAQKQEKKQSKKQEQQYQYQPFSGS